MKTERSINVQENVVWVNNVELSTQQEENMGFIGNCQLSTLLSNFNSVSKLTNVGDSNVTFLENEHLVVSEPDGSNVILRNNSGNNEIKINKEVRSELDQHENFADMLYFVCNLCPFLCTKDTKITEHLAFAHKNKTEKKLTQLKCPACPNIFFHKVSLRSHLVHDHQVGSSDLNKIIRAVIYFSSENKSDKNENNLSSSKGVIYCRDESDLKMNENHNIEENSGENQVSDNADQSDVAERFEEVETSVMEVTDITDNRSDFQSQSDQKVIVLPQLEVALNNAEKIFNTIVDQSSSIRSTEQKSTYHRCLISQCKVQLKALDKMRYHMICHCDNGFKCLECQEPFSFWKPLTSHLWRIHKIDMELYSCDKCDYKTYSLGKLNSIHKLIHSDVKAFTCKDCEKAFKNSKQLRNHMATHKKTEKEIIKCELCCKNFSDKRQLGIHMDVVHKKIKPYLCSFCGYKGSSRSSLRMHIRQHTGEKPFACDSCPYKTSDHNSLRRHKLRHTGQRPYKCIYCSYACIQSSTYKLHLKTKHPGLEKNLMFTCEHCQFRSVNKDMYTAHVLTYHKDTS